MLSRQIEALVEPAPHEPLATELLEAPLAAQRPHTLEAHGDVRQDDFYWLRDDDRKDPAVIAHLEVGARSMRGAVFAVCTTPSPVAPIEPRSEVLPSGWRLPCIPATCCPHPRPAPRFPGAKWAQAQPMLPNH